MVARQTMYEDGALGSATGGVLRPGGWTLTERMLAHCELRNGDRVLDVGCGDGSTIRYTLENHQVRAIGLDRSELLLHQALAQTPNLPLTCALGSTLPIASEQMDVVLAECSLSSMSGLESFLAETWRVLRPDGRLAVSDVYVRNPAGDYLLRALPLTCGLRNAFEQAEIAQCVQKQNFELLLWEDHSETLKELAGQIASTHGSIGAFWNQSEPAVDPLDIAIAISKAKLGYFLFIAKKNADIQGDHADG